MASVFARTAGAQVSSGLVAGPAASDLPPNWESFDAGHPWPNEASERAGRRALALARDRQSTLVVLLSGGASSMLAVPADGITLEQKTTTSRALMRAGVAIDGLNCVRKHLSAIKGGRLAAEAGQCVTLAISDVQRPVEDDPSVIGSGPTVADPTTFAQALAIVLRVAAEDAADIPRAVLDRLERGARGDLADTPKPGDVRLHRARYHVIGNRHHAMAGAAAAAQDLGYQVHVLPEATSGEARQAAVWFARRAWQIGLTAREPICVIASGETTVRVRGGGRGGRNQEFALGMARPLDEARFDRPLAAAASAGTDGIDGPTDAAGAIVDSFTVERARAAGLQIDEAFSANDSYAFFERLGDLIVWGPTGTNVGDVHVFVRR